MRELFPGFYNPTEEEFSKMWQESIFAFDANMLLNVYQYTPETLTSYFKILEYLKDRIWLPHQAVLEYQERRLDVISEQYRAYNDVILLLSTILKTLEKSSKAYEKHSFIDTRLLKKIIKEAIDKAKSAVQKAEQKHPKLHASDDLREKISDLFGGRIGRPYEEEELESIYEKAKKRFKWQVPPGYMDADKKSLDSKKYGDVILWFQLIDHACSQKRPIIFMTDDTKEDWWRRHEENIIGPRPELIQEMFSKAGVSFYMYQTEGFIAQAQKFFHLEYQPEVIEEVRDVRLQNEENQRSSHRGGILFSDLANITPVIDPALTQGNSALANIMSVIYRTMSQDISAAFLSSIKPVINPALMQSMSTLSNIMSMITLGEVVEDTPNEPNQKDAEISSDEVDQKLDSDAEHEEGEESGSN